MLFVTRQTVSWICVVPISVGLGWLFTSWGVPASWILGAIVAAGGYALSSQNELHVNKYVYRMGRGFIGILAALPLTVMPVGELVGYLPAGIAISLITILVGVMGGVLLHRAQPEAVSNETGILSMLPGGASMMPVLADELGADYRYVTLTQYLRLLAVSVTLPLVASMLVHPNDAAGAPAPPEPASQWWVLLLILAIAAAGEPLGRLVHLPVAPILGPLILTVAASLVLPAEVTLQPPELFRVFAFLVIGWVCGGALSVPALKRFAKQLPATILFIVAVMAVCALSAVPLMWWLEVTYFESYLATSPGALETVLALSSEGGAGPSVVAIQLVRLIMVLLIAGYLPQLIRLFSKR